MPEAALVASAAPIGVLALQGDVAEHLAALQRIGVAALAVKTEAQLASVCGLILPGGESTTLIRLLHRFALAAPLVARIRAGLPVWGTCMGMIVLAHEVAELEQETLDVLDICVRRNAFGRQMASAEVALDIPVLGPEPFPAIFIRAPWVESLGAGVEVLASHGGHGVLVRQGSILASAFHPELTHDDRLHHYFLGMITPFALD